MKKYLPILSSLILLVISIIFWDFIKLPYDESNNIVGQPFFNKFHPINDKIRFLFFITPSVLIYLFFYLRVNTNTFNFNIKSKEYFLYGINNKEIYYDNSLNFYSYLFILLITLEFFSLDLNRYIHTVDMFHDGTFLVPPLNYIENKELLKSTIYNYGFIGNNLGLLSNFVLGYYSIGSVTFISLILIYLNKVFIILISKKIISYLNFEEIIKKLLFIIFTFFLIVSIPHYFGGPRTSLFLFFIILLGSALCDNSFSKFKILLVGIFSLVSLLWWFDIGFYTNILIILTAIYLILNKENKKLLVLLIGIISSWSLFLLIVSLEEIKEFFYQLNFIYSTSHYSLSIEYIKPFSANSGRWTKALIVIYMASLMLIHLNFIKKFFVNYKFKIFVSLLFVAGVIVFNDALMRSDSMHVKSSSGLYTSVFVLLILVFLFQRIEIITKIKRLIYNLKFINFNLVIFILLSLAFLSSSKITNIFYAKNNIKKLVKAEDSLFLDNNLSAFLNDMKN